MNNISKNIKNEDGTNSTVVITSSDNHKIDTGKKYRLANHEEKKESKLSKKFKNSILGADIGVKSGGFTSVAILAVGIVAAVVLILYFSWRF